MKEVVYKNVRLMKGSLALELYTEKKFKELDDLMKDVEQRAAEALKRYEKYERVYKEEDNE